ncbi:MAG: pyridoxamine 5'-phosphate oxidase family protein [Solirubrobacteraceae bacterium]
MGAPRKDLTRPRRLPRRVSHDREAIDAILDEAHVAHLGVSIDGQPRVVPTLHARLGDVVCFHGSAASQTLRALAAGAPACLTVTLIDGFVLARSALHHSVNYRSAMIFGQAKPILDDEQRRAALEALVERLLPGRSGEVRAPTEQELRATIILALPLSDASAKVRSGPPLDDPEDLSLRTWAGEIPLALRAGAPRRDAHVPADVAPSRVVTEWVRLHA